MQEKTYLLLIDVKSIETDSDKFPIRQIECSSLEDYYDALQCETFDIARRKIGGHYFDIFVDDIGLFDESPIVSAIRWVDKDAGKAEPMLVGNLIIANHDAEGNTTSLTREDVGVILSNILWNCSDKGVYPILQCDW